MKRASWIVGALALFAFACSGADEKEEAEVPEIDCPAAEEVPKFSELTFLQTTCAQCHSSQAADAEREDAPVGVDFDTSAAAQLHAMEGVEELYEDPPAMPPAGSGLPAVTEEQKVMFNTWAQCGMPD